MQFAKCDLTIFIYIYQFIGAIDTKSAMSLPFSVTFLSRYLRLIAASCHKAMFTAAIDW